jgi:AcrR family transcriptional regulator
MTKAGSRGERSRVKIILAAEKLFARQGFEGVSIREIGAEAGQANSNAVQYHFGTKSGLLHAIFEYRVSHMDVARRALLKHAESQGRLQDMRTLVDILLLPYLDLTDEEGKHNYAVVMNEYMTRYRPRGVPHAGDELKKGTESLRYLLSLIERRIDYLPAQIAQSRLALCHLMFFNTLVMWDNDQTPMAQRAPLRSLIEDTLQIVTISFCLPDPNPMDWQGKIGTDADARDGVLTWGELPG